MDSSNKWVESQVNEYRKVTQITGFAPKSAVLTEVEARKEVSACRAPPKNVPKQLIKDFESGKRNAAACLNEVCQLLRKSCKFVETTPSTTYNLYGKGVFAMTAIVGGAEHEPGEATTKKAAKVEAAKNALNDILCLNTDRKDSNRSAERSSCDLYGRTVSMEGKRLSTAASTDTDLFRPLPQPVVPQKNNFLPAPSVKQIMELERKQPRLHESVGSLAEKKIHQLLSDFSHSEFPVYCQTFAAFIVKKTALPGEVVAIGSGDKSFHGQDLCTDGTLIFDCHAETVARRAFRRYLVEQISLWYKGGDNAREHCILENPQDSDMLCLKDSITIYLYLSKPPKGVARSLKEPIAAKEKIPADGHNLAFLTDSGNHEYKTYCDRPYVVTAEQLLSKQDNETSMVCMTGSDKILKWNVCGVQGSLLSLFIEPIYLDCITMGAEFPNDDCGSVIAAVNRRVDEGINSQLPDLFAVNPISHIGSYVRKLPQLHEELLEHQSQLSMNWSKYDESIEIVDGRLGMIDPSSPTKGKFSRISKLAFHQSCLKLAECTGRLYLNPGENYLTAKQSCQSYQETKTIFLRHLRDQGLGHWVAKPKQVNAFKL